MKILIAGVLFLCVAYPVAAQPGGQNVLTVTIENARSDKGKVWCALYASANGFPKSGESALMRASTSVQNRKGRCRFPDLGAGRYAVSVFHDENGNGKLDTNFVGMPKEGVGASNDASGRFGPPKFDSAAFEYRGGQVEIVVHLRYL